MSSLDPLVRVGEEVTGERERGREESMPLPDLLARVGEEVVRDERDREIERWVSAWGVESRVRGRSRTRAAIHWPLKRKTVYKSLPINLLAIEG
jgi:hypothetical protein